MITKNYIYKIICVVFSLVFLTTSVSASQKTNVVKKVKPSVVGVGLYDAMSAVSHQLRGSGFVFGDGTLIATNFHVVSEPLDPQIVQYHIVFSGTGRQPKIHKAEIIAKDPVHDLAILKIRDTLPALQLGPDEYVDDGQDILMTGFPIGSILGLYPATHKGMIAALTPDVIPSANARNLTMKMRNRLESPFMIYQLDMTAYPGNSGSAIYDAETGRVVGIINKVFIKETKEAVLEKPSGISYAIPVKYLRLLSKKKGIAVN
ncbi:peptidase S1 and S6, chymotrypsin/Hap [Paraglaciecola sp. T6c]|uniref:S1 family peptidase n=1 Tax=Pseudoalteromonas atlantica (strain T6c / ATCC BAA-1087) TaxID=3042615 RepID=UPI00005C6C7E|nr:serine protease [Paraglaciecola sp. T6c]ABG39734.1 peptidase S1 and S6, chymotrypsin/Hap [Paraglaciecola sp. T6c]